MFKVVSCIACHDESTDLFNWARVSLPNRGGRVAFLCPSCKRRMDSYFDDNDNPARGTTTAKRLTTGFEFEVDYPTYDIRAYLMQLDFIPSHDSTVDCEFKSPVYKSLNPIKGVLRTLEKKQAANEFEVSSRCGTHVHIGHRAINAYTNRAIAANYKALFAPLSNYLDTHPYECAAVFGRSLDGWAAPIDTMDPYEHCNFVNIQHNDTIEYRVCKFVNAKQFMLAIQTCQKFTLAILNNYIAHFGEGNELHKAEITGQKLVKLFQRAYAQTLK